MTGRVVPAVVVIVVTNLVLLSSARFNRSGEPEAILRLTERELPMTWRQSDRNSAVELMLSAPMAADGNWLRGPKVAALGYDTRVPANEKEAGGFILRQLSRRVYGVFEFEGRAWTEHVQQEEQRRALLAARGDSAETRSALEALDRSLETDSRLFSVDTSTDPVALRASYPDRTHYVILPSTVHVFPSIRDDESGVPRTQLGGQVRPVTIDLVVPVHLRPVLDRLKSTRTDAVLWKRTPPRYAVTMAVGHRLEPWIVSIDAIDTPAARH